MNSARQGEGADDLRRGRRKSQTRRRFASRKHADIAATSQRIKRSTAMPCAAALGGIHQSRSEIAKGAAPRSIKV